MNPDDPSAAILTKFQAGWGISYWFGLAFGIGCLWLAAAILRSIIRGTMDESI